MKNNCGEQTAALLSGIDNDYPLLGFEFDLTDFRFGLGRASHVKNLNDLVVPESPANFILT